MAQLDLSVSASTSATYNLTTLGTADWIVYPNKTAVRKNGGGGIIAVNHIGTFTDNVATDGNVTSTWSDGAGTVSGSTHSLIFSGTGAGIGYAVVFPADTGTRTAYVIAGVYGTNLQVTATLSDGSSTQQSTVFPGSTTAGMQTFIRIDYSAASAGQTLTVSLTQTGSSQYSNTSFQSAAVTPPPQNTTITPDPASITLSTYSPTVSRGVTTSVSPGTGTLAFQTYAPTIAQGMNTTVVPGTKATTITGYAPTIVRQASLTITPLPATISIQGYTLTVSQMNNLKGTVTYRYMARSKLAEVKLA